ncbi:MAG: copper resistance protein NlpE [Pseudomonadota bacterium]|nr:copper resistance protein NlpE [Pseudomonadota bacterium]
MKTYIAAAVLGSAVLITGCQSQPPEEPANPTAQKVTYSGMLPCADCSGIRTTLTLYRDQYDNPTRFELREDYLSGSKVELSATERGSWEAEKRLQANNEFDVYTINPDDPEADRYYIKDAVNAIEQLDRNGNRIESNMNYRLLRK